MKAIIDKAIPYIQGVLEPFFDVEYLPGKDIDRTKAADADVLLIRTRTHCNEALLSGSKVKLVATATIGCDHIDMPWCREAGIKVVNAPGCNSSAVMEYFFTAIYKLAEMKGYDLLGQTIGVVGVGHVGSKVANMAEELGFRVLRNDPPRMAAEGPKGFVDLDTLLKHSDIVTIHIPLENNLDFAGDHFFDSMKDGAIFVNASRGEVIVEESFHRNRPRFAGV
ncbi:MAG: erythronate-4-phosphate dehydrogenase, partial [Bacteroidales bacterium]|nr:erythronate-4-phosphate dehydrogenase [Bacteroidales bacterium]